LWLQRRVREPEVWRREREARPHIGQLFRGAIGRNMLICATMNAATLFAWWGLFTWVPHFFSMSIAEGGRGLSVTQTSQWTIVMQVGTFLGYVSFGYIADRFSRKYTYIGFLLAAALLVPFFAFVRNADMLLVIGPLVGFFGTGYFSGFSVIASELFPTSLRGSALGFVYNIGRVLSAAAPYLIGHISEGSGLSAALCVTAGAFLVAALIATALRPPVSLTESNATS
jgi:MFS family permease